jgi:hypothetical protein
MTMKESKDPKDCGPEEMTTELESAEQEVNDFTTDCDG